MDNCAKQILVMASIIVEPTNNGYTLLRLSSKEGGGGGGRGGNCSISASYIAIITIVKLVPLYYCLLLGLQLNSSTSVL